MKHVFAGLFAVAAVTLIGAMQASASPSCSDYRFTVLQDGQELAGVSL